MNTKPIFLLSLCCALIGTGVLLTSCASTGYQKAAATSDTLTTAATQVDLARSQISEATTALNALVMRPSEDLRPAFKRYQTVVTSLDETVAALNQQTLAMESQGRKYFDTWDARVAAMKNEDIRSRSQERQQEVTAQFTDIQQRYQDARRQFEPFIANLHDIQGLLSVDLTPAGVGSAREFVDKAQTNAASVRRALDHLAEGLRAFSVTLNPAPAPTTG